MSFEVVTVTEEMISYKIVAKTAVRGRVHAERAGEEESPAYKTKAEVATDVLRRAVLAGELAPGEPLTVASLAERFGLTLMPLREALSHLAAEGLVEIEPHQSARVARLSHERMNEEYAVRAILEAAAAAQATTHLDDAAFGELGELLRRMDKARDARRTADFWALTKRYHEHIYAAAPSRLLREEVERVRVRTLRYLPAFQRDQHLVHAAQREHWEIFEALRTRDADRVERLVRAHVATVARAVRIPDDGDADRT
jgi:DNA-binding GntR family transcriptional regulator